MNIYLLSPIDGESQLSALEVEETRMIANVRSLMLCCTFNTTQYRDTKAVALTWKFGIVDINNAI